VPPGDAPVDAPGDAPVDALVDLMDIETGGDVPAADRPDPCPVFDPCRCTPCQGQLGPACLEAPTTDAGVYNRAICARPTAEECPAPYNVESCRPGEICRMTSGQAVCGRP
jgi:hypothetical protein